MAGRFDLCALFALSFALLLALPSCVALEPSGSAHAAPVIETTIDQLMQQPLTYRDKIVRVRGVLDECYSLNCRLCTAATKNLPEEQQICVSPQFGDPARRDEPDRSPAERTRRHLDELYRFSDLTVEGRFDPKRWPIEGGGEAIAVCSDRCPDLVAVTVVQVHQRWPATQATFHTYEGELMPPMPRAAAKKMRADYAALQAAYGIELDEPSAYKMFWDLADDGTPSTRLGVLCTCVEDSCTDQWPTKFGHTIKSPNNPYTCLPAALIKGRWSF